jgi:alkanesulfonate monooxygenase SsuD/methylene tetrahydromethanopterin reductase-like flavin-dependent oxidoreductase (luciferase family)
VPIELKPVQQPHPPFWYGVHTPENAEINARRGFNIVTGDDTATVRSVITRYRAVWREMGRTPESLPKLGLTRFVVIADDDDTTLATARRAYPKWQSSFGHLYHSFGRSPVLGERPRDFDSIRTSGVGVAGSPDTVASVLREQVAQCATNYVLPHFIFGDVTLAEALRTIRLFKGEVMPVLREQEAAMAQ